jgi:isochorismate hydrolase
MQSPLNLIRPLVHLSIDLGVDYVSGLAHYNAEYAEKLPADIDAFAKRLHRLDFPTIWTGRAEDELFFMPFTRANYSHIPAHRKFLATPNANDWLSSKIDADALSNPQLCDALKKWRTSYVILTGLSVEACVSDTMTHLLQMGFNCIVPMDLIAGYMGNATYGSEEFYKWNEEAILSIYDSARTKYKLRGDLTLANSSEVLSLIRKDKRPAQDEPASIERQFG